MSGIERNIWSWLSVLALVVTAVIVVAGSPAVSQDLQGQSQPQPAETSPALAVENGVMAGMAFSFEALTAHAAGLASKPHSGKADTLPQWMADLDYDVYRKIRFKSDKAISVSDTVRLQLFHPGFLFREPVRIALLSNGIVKDIAFDKALFAYGELSQKALGDEGAGAGTQSAFAGFRLHFPVNMAGVFDEVLAFHGASYFRLLGSGQQYGLSARGLAVDTAAAKGEEFPRFTAFWIEQGALANNPVRIYVLLESESVTGAYRFEFSPGNGSVMTVDARLFARKAVGKRGIAPLTSMFLYGENRNSHYDDYRPEIHDSDGLLMNNGAGEWLWRPLSNPRTLGVNAFGDENPRGFGLFQRDADFNHYRDLEAHYDRRPSYWVEPQGDWGKGHVELVEIPRPDETNDNIVAFWVPEKAMEAGGRRDFSYRLTALDSGLAPHQLGRASLSLNARAHVPGTKDNAPAGTRRHIVEFSGETIDYASQFMKDIKVELGADKGRTTLVSVQNNPEEKAIRVTFDAVPSGPDAMDIRLFLTLKGAPVTEVWTRTQVGLSRP